MGGWIDGRMDRWTDWTNGQTEGRMNGLVKKLMDGQTDVLIESCFYIIADYTIGKKANIQLDRYIDRLTDRH